MYRARITWQRDTVWPCVRLEVLVIANLEHVSGSFQLVQVLLRSGQSEVA